MSESRIIYEFPITNRMRSFLRFEYLIDKIETSMNGRNHPVETIHSLHQLLDLLRHNDVKSELLRHLRWQEQELQKFSDSSSVDRNKLSQAVHEKQEMIKSLDDFSLPLSRYADNHFLNSAKLRLSVPAGTCNFDLPQLHAWLHFSDDTKLKELEAWFKPFRPIKAALKSTLSLTRTSAEFSLETAEKGCYLNNSPSDRHACLIRIATDTTPEIYPEVSSGPRHLSVYFFEIANLETRPGQTRRDVQFNLARCTL